MVLYLFLSLVILLLHFLKSFNYSNQVVVVHTLNPNIHRRQRQVDL